MKLKVLCTVLVVWLIGGVLGIGQTSPAHALASDPEALQVTLQDLGYGDFSLRGMYGAARLWIPFREDWLFTRPVPLEVTYVASPLLHPRSTLTLYANDLEVASLHPVADGQAHTLTVTIPPERLQGKGLVLDFQGYLRLTDDPCEETNNPGQWIQILTRKTRLYLEPVWRPARADLHGMAQRMVVRSARDYGQEVPPLIFVLPEAPTVTELTVASQVAARLVAERHFLPPVRVVFAQQSRLPDLEDGQVIVVGTPARNPWLKDLGAALPAAVYGERFLDAQHQALPDDQGVVELTTVPGRRHRYLLVVSGTTETGLRRAGQVFATRPRFLALQGSYVFIDAQPPTVEPQPPLPWTTETTSFAQLGESDHRVNGLGIHNLYFYFQRPPGWMLDREAKLVLRFLTSPALTSRESYIAVFINDVPVGAVRTGPEFPTEATLTLPVARLNQDLQGGMPARWTVRLEVGNFAREQNCEQVHPEAAWTVVRADSYFVTPHVYAALPDLMAFPYPFAAVEKEAPPTWILLPPSPQPREIAQALSLAALFGMYTPLDRTTRILPGDAVSEADLAEPHLIVLGDRERQPWISTLLENMGAVPGYRGERGLYRALQSPQQGLLREGPSPWNPERVVLMAFGTTPEGAAHAAEALLRQVPPVDTSGSVALVDPWGRAQVIYRAVTHPPVLQPNKVFREPLLPSPQPWVVITGILTLAVLTILGIIFWVRRRYGHQE